jgi:hypothetical protein
MSFFGGFMQNSIAIDYLDETGPVKVSFNISERIGSDIVSASVTFSAKGLQPVHPEGSVSINGIPMATKKLQKQGYWYPLDIPKAAKYQLNVKRSKSAFESVYTILPRKFIPQMPLNISRSKDIIIRYDGTSISKPERLFITLGPVESEVGGQLWEITPKSTIDGDKIIISAKDIAKARTGRASFYIGLSSFQTPVDSDNRLTYTVGQTLEVSILD